MLIKVVSLPAAKPACHSCAAGCCRLEVLLITETGVPKKFIETDQWGGSSMRRLADGWCAALDRATMLCTIYEQRPLICREFAMGSAECRDEWQPIAGVSG